VLVQTCCLSVCRSVSQSVGLSVCRHVQRVYCGKTADCIWMPSGVVSGVSRGMGVLDEGGDHQRGRGNCGGKYGHPIVTNGDFIA